MWKNTYKKAIPRTANVFKPKFTNKIQSQIDANENFTKKKKNSTHECTKYKFILINNVIFLKHRTYENSGHKNGLLKSLFCRLLYLLRARQTMQRPRILGKKSWARANKTKILNKRIV